MGKHILYRRKPGIHLTADMGNTDKEHIEHRDSVKIFSDPKPKKAMA